MPGFSLELKDAKNGVQLNTVMKPKSKERLGICIKEEKELERHQELLEQFSPEEVEMIELGEIWVGASGVAVLYSWGKPDNVIEGSKICKFEYDFEEGRKRPNYWVKLKKTVGGRDLEDLVVVEYNSSTRN